VAAALVLASAASAAGLSAVPSPSSPSPFSPRVDDFPSPDKILGAADDPLAGLTNSEEDLRDALAAAPSAAWLMTGLRMSNPADRLAAIHSAGVPRHSEAIPHLTGVLLRLDEKPALRAAAAVALGRIGHPLAATALAEALGDPVPEVRYAAALALGRLPADGAATRLSRSLRFDPSWWVRYAAAIALGRTRKTFAVPALEERLRMEPVWQVRMQAVRSLQDIGGPRAAAAVTVALRDRDSGVRAAAALALGELGREEDLPAMREALRAESDSSTRAVLSAAFRRVLAKP
jgi:HEAT repeat protein